MRPIAHSDHDPYLTIVPEDAFVDNDVLDTIVDVTQESEGAPIVPPADPFSLEPAPARAAAAPAKKTSKLVVASALGGGMVFGGGLVAAVSLVAVLAVGAVGVAGGGAWWWMSQPAPAVAEAPVLPPVEDDVAPVASDDGTGEGLEAAGAADESADDEGTDDDVDADADADAATAPAPRRAPTRAPAAPVPTAAAPPAVAPAAPEIAADEIPADDILVKIITDPPAATVTVDGRAAGRSPLKAFMPAGNHTVVVESGKASGEFVIDPMSDDRVCFKAKGRKVQRTSCN